MTAEAKAVELVKQMSDKIISFENVRLRGEGFEMAKQCALIAASEVANVVTPAILTGKKLEYWEQVKTEINKL